MRTLISSQSVRTTGDNLRLVTGTLSEESLVRLSPSLEESNANSQQTESELN